MSGVVALNDAVLDGAYAASYDNGDFTAANYYGAEIVARLITPWSFLTGVLGAERFPKYASRTKFSQSEAAQKSVLGSAGSLADKAGSLADKVGSALKIGGVTLALVALAGVVVFAATR